MPLGTYYIDTTDFTTATGIYSDVNLTTYAASGLYQSCGVYRNWDQITTILGPVITCPYCATGACGILPSNGWETSREGVYDLDVELTVATGAWKIAFTPAFLPNKVEVTLGATTYSSVQSSSNFGYLGAGPYYGDIPTATAYSFPALSPYYVAVQQWNGEEDGAGVGTVFTPSGGLETINIAPGDFSGSAGAPGALVMFIPKTLADVQTANIKLIGPIGGTYEACSISNNCAAPLTGFLVSLGHATQPLACASAFFGTYYNGPVNGIPGSPALYDVMFANSTSATTLASVSGIGPGTTKFFKFTSPAYPSPPGGYFELDEYSVIISIGSC